MESRRVPIGIKLLIGVGIYILTFLLARPSDPSTQGERAFWIKAANLFGERDIEGFVGIALLIGCLVITLIVSPVIIRVIERRLRVN